MSVRLPAWFGRVFGDSENPLLWSIPLGRIWGCDARVHVIFPIVAALWLVRSISRDHPGLIFEVWRIGAVIIVVGVHEFGRIVTARLLRNPCDEIVAWPLGGLVHRTEAERGAAVLAALGGPVFLMILLGLTTAGTVWVTGSFEFVRVNPFGLGDQERIVLLEGVVPWSVWMLHAVTATVLLLNLALPAFPMDAGWLARAVIATRVSDRSSWRSVAGLGLIVAALLAGFGWVIEEMLPVGLAAVIAFVSWHELRRQRFLAVADMVDLMELAEDSRSDWPRSGPDDDESEREREHLTAEVDRILEKISTAGIASLSKQEHRALDRASRLHRQRID